MTRISNITSFGYVDPAPHFRGEGGTNLLHHWKDEYWTTRVPGVRLTRLQVEEYEEAFLERRHRKSA